MENRMLSQMPAFSFQTLWSGAFTGELEGVAADQIPLRDGFVSLYAAMQYALGRRMLGDAIIGADGTYYDRSAGWRTQYVRLNASALETLSAQTGRETLLLAVPSAAAVYPEKLPAGVPVADEEALLEAAGKTTRLLPLLDEIRASRLEAPLYYATDHHWTAAGARIGYLTVCEALGLEPCPEEATRSYEGFYGSFYARYPLPWHRGDTFAWQPVEGVQLFIDGEAQETLISEQTLAGRDKYAALLHGNHSVVELVNESAPGSTLLVVKDSYANALLPMLAQHYRRIVAVDPRYFAGDIVALFNQYEGGMILCVYGVSTLATGRTIALLEGL